MLIIVDDCFNARAKIYDKVNSEIAIRNIVNRLNNVYRFV